MHILLGILLNSIVPIFILISLGFILDKRMKLDINVVTKLNFYIYLPAFVFVSIYTTEITIEMVRVMALAVVLLLMNFLLGAGVASVLKLPRKTAKAFENSLMFFNAANIGVPLVTLVFSNPPFIADVKGHQASPLELALSVQIMILLVQSLTTNTFGFINSGGDGMTLKTGILRVLRMPTPYAIVCAVLFKLLPIDFTETPMWPSILHLRYGMVSVALLALGIQLAKTRLDLKIKTPFAAAFFRLICGPAMAFLLIKLFGFEGVIAQTIFIASAAPSAVNTALLSIECKGDVDFAVQTVTVSTLLSSFTMTSAVYMAYLVF